MNNIKLPNLHPRVCFLDLVGMFTNPVGTLLGPTGLGVGGPSGMSPSDASLLAGKMASESSASAIDRTNAINVAEAQKNRDFQRSTMGEQNAYNTAEAEKARLFNASEAKIARDYAKDMSNSAYQRATEDMKKAGINPMLAYIQGGASSPNVGAASSGSASSSSGASGSQARVEAPTGAAEIFARKIQESVSNAFEAKRLKKDLEVGDSVVNMNKAAAQTTRDMGQVHKQTAKKIAVQTRAETANAISAEEEAKNRKQSAQIEQNPILKYTRKIIEAVNPLTGLFK